MSLVDACTDAYEPPLPAYVPLTPNIDTPFLIFAATRLESPLTYVAAVVYLPAATAVFCEVPGVIIPPLFVGKVYVFEEVSLVLKYPLVLTLDVAVITPVDVFKLIDGSPSAPFGVVADTLTLT